MAIVCRDLIKLCSLESFQGDTSLLSKELQEIARLHTGSMLERVVSSSSRLNSTSDKLGIVRANLAPETDGKSSNVHFSNAIRAAFVNLVS